MLPSGEIGSFHAAGYLLPMNSYLKNASWWKGFPKVVQSESTFNGSVYGVDVGENTGALLYDKVLFKKAGLPVPWRPKTWADVLAAAQKLKASLPSSVIPLFAMTGVGNGASGVNYGIANLISGTSTPQIYDVKTGKWVVDSPGIEAALGFYQKVYALGLGAPESMLASPSAPVAPINLFPEGKLGIAIGESYMLGNYTKTISSPYWKNPQNYVGYAPIPTENGQAPGYASALSGWDYAIAARSPHPQLAFDFVSLVEDSQNSISLDNSSGWIPPNKANWTNPAYANFCPYQTPFANLLPSSTLIPTESAYPVWVQGMSIATGLFVQNPHTSVSQAMKALSSYVSQQLGKGFVETIG
jgi:multiple sugar transport system substrate-binding protein